MDLYPNVIVLSYGAADPAKVIENIIGSTSLENKQNVLYEKKNFTKYLYKINTKYYETSISLIALEGGVDGFSVDLAKLSEAIIVIFDPQNKSFMEDLPKIKKLVESNKNIGLVMLLTSKLLDDELLGITYKQIKSTCPIMFDIIELTCDDDDTTSSSTQYKEVLDALHNYVWSNVNYKNSDKCKMLSDNTGRNPMEDELDAFEKLLFNIQNFKKVSSRLGREETLNEAEKIAEIFANLINED